MCIIRVRGTCVRVSRMRMYNIYCVCEWNFKSLFRTFIFLDRKARYFEVFFYRNGNLFTSCACEVGKMQCFFMDGITTFYVTQDSLPVIIVSPYLRESFRAGMVNRIFITRQFMTQFNKKNFSRAIIIFINKEKYKWKI